MPVLDALRTVKRRYSVQRHLASITTHKTRMEQAMARPYTSYLARARAGFHESRALPKMLAQRVAQFNEQGFASFWTEENQRLAQSMFQRIQREEQQGLPIWNEEQRYTTEIYTVFPELEPLFRGSLGAFLTGVYGTPFKIFYGVLYRSEHLTDRAVGSQLWHDDGGPGTCINVMFYLKEVAKADGAMECLPWPASFEIYKRELQESAVQRRIDAQQAHGITLTRGQAREVRCEYYREQIARSFSHLVQQPTGDAGLILPFRNNIIHKGGFPQPGRTRYVCVFHCYPSDKPTPFERYRQVGIPKRGSLPKDPAEEF